MPPIHTIHSFCRIVNETYPFFDKLCRGSLLVARRRTMRAGDAAEMFPFAIANATDVEFMNELGRGTGWLAKTGDRRPRSWMETSFDQKNYTRRVIKGEIRTGSCPRRRLGWKCSDFSKPCTVVESQFIGILRLPSVDVASFHGQQQRQSPTHPELVQLSTGGEITRRFIKETSWTFHQWSTSKDKKKDAQAVVEIWK